MSETVWILMTVGAWLLVMGAISVFGELAKESDRARHNLMDDERARLHATSITRQAVSSRAQ
jgi:hypothetical protein